MVSEALLGEHLVRGVVRPPSALSMVQMVVSLWRFIGYLRSLIARKREKPEEDLLSMLVEAKDGEERLSEDELLSMAFLLLVAGHETTVSLIANGMLAFLRHPQEWSRLREDRALLPSAVEECLRYDGPLLTSDPYYAREAITLHEVTIPAGAPVLLAVLSANRDEAVFADADRFDIQRQPNKHLAFGKGLHHCLGAPLARLEGQLAFNALLDAPPFQLASALTPRYRRTAFLHRLTALPIRFNAL